jgi:hypothetical protein
MNILGIKKSTYFIALDMAAFTDEAELSRVRKLSTQGKERRHSPASSSAQSASSGLALFWKTSI